MTAKVLIPSGALGITYSKTALKDGLKKNPDIIVIDGGSTDSGPAYLGQGISKYSRSTTKAEWKTLMEARASLKIPLVIGSAGTCGTNSSVDWFLEITQELAKELGQRPKIAVLRCSQSKTTIKDALKKGLLKPLQYAPPITEERIQSCTNIVGLAGVEQITKAINTGADIIIAGRSTDASLIASYPILNGVEEGIAWHGGKIGECGAFCSTNPKTGVILISFEKKGFTVEPMEKDAQATPDSVAAHMVYENSDPFILREPGGCLDVESAFYEKINERSVHVTGSKWIDEKEYSIKLEGAYVAGYQNVSIVLIRDKKYVEHIDAWTNQIKEKAKTLISQTLGLEAKNYQIQFRLIGKNATLGNLETNINVSCEIGVLGIVTAQSPNDAEEIGKILNPLLLHHSLFEKGELPTFAFPFSPPSFNAGAKYEFCLNHAINLKDPMDIFQLEEY
ncbi:MAG: acyclic terpene utilization AtuA family protein [Paracoccaceae bacterium]|nr:acyclic terpene utilization AtuA family protein [Paracoccaceae bacterium]